MVIASTTTTTRPAGGTALVVGLVAAVMVVAFEATAVVTVMPTIADDLHGDTLYGAAFASFMLANLVSAVVAAELADRRGPAASFGLGVAGFGLGLLVAGLAPSMGMLVAGRFLQGIGAGGLAATAYVAVGRGFPAEAQPRLFALLSTGWVLPSLVGPAAAGFAAEHWGWRSVFLGLVVPVAALPLLVLPSLATLPPASGSPGASRVPAALVLAAGAGLAVAGLQAAAWPVVLGLLTLGIAIALPALRRLLPAGTGRARPGLAAVVASRLLVNLAFFGADTFLPLAATRIHGASPTTAGLVIIGGALAWTGGAAWSARRQAGPPSRKVVAGFALLAFGIAGASFVVWPAFPLWAVFLLWSVGGLGIGAVFNTTSVAGLASAPDGREGMVSSQLQIVDALGFAVAAGVGGALVGLADRTAVTLGAAVAVTFALAASAALLGTVAGRGVRAAVPVPAPPV